VTANRSSNREQSCFVIHRTATIGSVFALTAVAVVPFMRPAGAQLPTPTGDRVVEIRVYTLKTGVRERFHRQFVRESLPMLRRWKVDVVAYGPSLHDDDSYYLVRSFQSLAERVRSEDAFYGSSEWREGPRDAVLAAIASYSTAVLTMDEQALQWLREPVHDRTLTTKTGVAMPETGTTAIARAADLTALLALNEDYLRAVQTSDVQRFRELLSDDFLASLSDGSQVDRNTFLKQIAAPATITDLKALDVNVRLMGDFAIVHARTTFRMADGRPGASRYTDTWVRRDGRWVAVAAHVTRY
jgi:ketosteroid isomerase-like protein